MTPRQHSVLITGCSPGGVGHALAKQYYKQGFRVFASARRIEVLKDLEAQGIETISLDVTDQTAIKAAVAEISGRTGGTLDILVNNAGKAYTAAATDTSLEDIQSIFMTNLFSVMLMCQAFAPLLISAKGKIVNIGSIVALVPFPFGSAYNASKAALHSYGDTLRVEMKPFDVKVITVITGGVKSNVEANDQGRLAPGSLYYPMIDLFLEKRAGHSQKGAMTTGDYASYVVKETIKPNTRPWLWRGNFALTIWLSTFLPTGFTDGWMSRSFGLGIFKERLALKSAAT